MAVYVYIAVPSDGRGPVRGTITADSPRQARDQLRAQGFSIRDVAEQTAGGRQSWIAKYLDKRQTGKVTGLLQEISTLLAADIALLEALDTIARQHSGRFRRSIMLLRDHVAAGGSLAEAMALQPTLFDNLCRSIVEVGENAGTLDASLLRLVEFRRASAGVKNKVASALIYPAVVLTTGGGVGVFLMTYVVPNLTDVLLASGKELPAATMAVRAVSDFLLGWWWALLLVLGAGVGGLTAFVRTEGGLRAWHRGQLKIPVIGDLIRKQTIARVALVMAALLESGMVFIRAVEITRRTVGHRVLRDALAACEEAVSAGRDISVALEKTGAFPPLVIQVFAVGQESGRLEEMLENLAADYDTQVDLAATRLTAMLEPVMTVILAIAVGFIAFATILPILEAGDVL